MKAICLLEVSQAMRIQNKGVQARKQPHKIWLVNISFFFFWQCLTHYVHDDFINTNRDPEEFEHSSKWQELNTCISEAFLCGSQDFRALNLLVFAGRPASFHFEPVELRFSGVFSVNQRTQLSHKRYLI